MEVRRIRDAIVIHNIPIPPSVNQLYKTLTIRNQIRRAPSKKYKDWQNQCRQMYLENAHKFRCMQVLVQQILEELDCALEVRYYFFFHRDKIYCKDNTFKKMDVSNRIKAVEDMVFSVLDMDDRVTWKVIAEKIECPSDVQESVSVTLQPFHPRKKDTLLQQINLGHKP